MRGVARVEAPRQVPLPPLASRLSPERESEKGRCGETHTHTHIERERERERERQQVTGPASERETPGYRPCERERDNRLRALQARGRQQVMSASSERETTGYEPFERERDNSERFEREGERGDAPSASAGSFSHDERPLPSVHPPTCAPPA